MESILPSIYRSSDPIDNLLVRVSLCRRIPPIISNEAKLITTRGTSSSIASGDTDNRTKSQTAASYSSSTLNSTSSAHTPNDEDSFLETTASFAWQQKVYSPKELLRFAAIISQKRSHDQNKSSPVKLLNESLHNLIDSVTGNAPLTPKNAIEESYVTDIENRLENGEPVFESCSAVMLFTYVDADGVIPRDARSIESSEENIGAFNGISATDEWRNRIDKTLTDSVLDPIGTRSRATAGAFKEHPFSTMYIMAALSIDTTAFRARQIDCKMTEVCLAVVRAYKGSSSLLVEIRPGFAIPVPYDRSSLIALSRSVNGDSSSVMSGSLAAQQLIDSDNCLGNGQFGGSLRLKTLPTLPHSIKSSEHESFSSSSTGFPVRSLNATLTNSEGTTSINSLPLPLYTNERSTDICAYAIETHRFGLPDGSQYEYSVTNADEDIGKVLKAAANSSGSSLSPYLQKLVDTGIFNPNGESSLSTDTPLYDQIESDLTAMQHADQESLELHSHRLGSEFYSKVPRALLIKNILSFKLSYYLEIVAAAKFYDTDSVYITYELQLPKGSGWRILPLTDIPEHHHTIAERKKESGRDGEVVFRGKGFSDDVGVLDQDHQDLHWDHDVLLKDREEEHRESHSVRENDENSPMFTSSLSIDPDKRLLAKKRQSLRSTPIQGVTQVAHFSARPWTFGSSVASLSTGIRPFGTEGNAGSSDPFFGIQGNEIVSNTDVEGGNQCLLKSHPFGFEAAATTLAPGHARANIQHDGKTGKSSFPFELVQKVSTGGISLHSNSRSLSGLGSSSLLSSVSSDLSFGSAGVVSSTSAAPQGNTSFERVSIPPQEIVPVAHIGYPLELHLACDLSSVSGGPGDTSGTGGMPSHPVLFISVMNRDSWDRHRSCGYTYIDLPITAGIRDLIAPCWKPKGSPAQAESDFYLGGSTRLAGISYVRVPSEIINSSEVNVMDDKGISSVKANNIKEPLLPINHLSRFGFEAETTGEIGIRCCSIIQRGSQPIRLLNQSAHLSQVVGQTQSSRQSMTGANSASSSSEGNRIGNARGSSTSKSVEEVISEARSLRRRDRGSTNTSKQDRIL